MMTVIIIIALSTKRCCI